MNARSLAVAGMLAAPLSLVWPAGAAGEARIAVLPVVVHAFDGRDYLQAGLADMLSARLERTPGIAVVRVREAGAATTDPDAAREAAGARGAEYVLFGSYTQFGEGASLDLHCARVAGGEDGTPGGVARAVFIHSGTPAEIIPRLDEVTDKVSRYVLAGAGPVATAGEGAPAAAPGVDPEVLRRLEALERAVFDGPIEAAEVGTRGPAEPVEELDLRAGERPE